MKPSRNLWPLGIILTFVVFISGTVGLVVLASMQRTDLVSANYYEQEIKYQSHIDSADRAKSLGTNASITYDAALKRILITVPEEQARTGVFGKIDLYRPSAAGLDRQFPIDMKYSHVQSIDASELNAGPWRVRAIWSANNTEFSLDQKIVVGANAKVAAASTQH
jgi:nitrogen fixation protein FixH